MVDILAEGWALMQGKALIRAWALIRGNTVYGMGMQSAKEQMIKEHSTAPA